MQSPKEPMQITSLNLPKRLHALLVSAARGRQNREGGRCSVSALVTELIERSTDQLEVLSGTGKESVKTDYSL